MIRVRNDDVLVSSSDWTNPLERFSKIHRWVSEVPEHFIHVPAILTTEIQQFPDCIEFIKSETKAGRMVPELHGFHHEIDYRTRSYADCVKDLDKAVEWMDKNLGVRPTIWYTPRGGDHPPMREAAATLSLEFVSAFDNKLEGRNGICRHLMDGRSWEAVSNSRIIPNGHKEIGIHWWSRGMRLKRVIEAVRHGSWANAEKISPELFSD